MAAAPLKIRTHPTKTKLRKPRETTISTSAVPIPSSDLYPVPHHRHLDPITVVQSDSSSWRCSAAKSSIPPHPSLPQDRCVTPTRDPSSPPPSDSNPTFKPRFSPGRVSPVMDFSSSPADNGGVSCHDAFPSNFTKFNSVLNAGLLNPASLPPPPSSEKTRPSPTLVEMMASEPDCNLRGPPTPCNQISANPSLVSAQDIQSLTYQRILESLATRSPGSLFNDPSGDIKLTLSSKDGIGVSVDVHRQILVAQSSFFSTKLSDPWSKQPYIVEIADCEDVEVYIETLRLMYCSDLKRKLMKEGVCRVLDILKVSAAMGFDLGVSSCLEYLEAAPWAEDEEEKVASLLSELRLEGGGAVEVLKRLSVDVSCRSPRCGEDEEVLIKLFKVVLDGKDEKARREMKGLMAKMLHENASKNDLRRESLYSACDGCLQSLRCHFLQAANSELQGASQIARQADNLYWILDILIDRQIADEFLWTWASQREMATAHPKVPAIHRHEISRVTARLFVGIGKGQVVAPRGARCMLVQTWLPAFYDDFGWMRRASKGLDRHLIEDGLCNTILTLPLDWQQEVLLAWFSRFLNSSDDCPNIQRGFEVWWQRTFWRRNGDVVQPQQPRIAASAEEKS